MSTEPFTRCPFHTAATPPSSVDPRPPSDGAAVPPMLDGWPPGPASRFTGWSHLARMSRDLLGTLAHWQRRFGDVVHVRIWPEHQAVVTDPDLVRELLVSHHDALTRQARSIAVFERLDGRSVLILEGDAWKARRAALQPAFAPRSVQAFVPTIAQAAQRALGRWPARDTDWPVEQALTSLAMDVIMRMTFSTDIGDDARSAERAVHDALHAVNAELYWPASWPDRMPWKRRKRRALTTLDALIERHLHARLTHPEDAWPDDLLTRLLRLHRADPVAWPRRAVRDECMTAFLAGHETVAATLTWWAWCMAANPAAQARAADEVARVMPGGRAPRADDLRAMPWLVQTLQETMRLYPAAPMLVNRRTSRPLALGGWRFPARTLFMLPVHALHHDARWFPEAEAFRPERFDPAAPPLPRGAWIPFGTGARVCLGQHLAMAEMTVVAAMVLQRFALAVPPGSAPPEPVLEVSLRPRTALRLSVEARQAPA